MYVTKLLGSRNSLYKGSIVKLISGYIAPWALSNEEIPIHLVWDPSLEYKFIQVETPEGITVKDLFNVESFEKRGSRLTINALKTPNYLGFLVSSQVIHQKPHVRKEIKVEFISPNNEKHSHSFVANIYRPLLTFEEKPKKVIFSDDSNLRNLVNFSLKLQGFGRIRTRFEISTGGEFRTRAEPLYREVVRRMVSSLKLDETSSEEKKDIEIDAIRLQAIAKEFIGKMKKGEFPLDVGKEDLEDFQRWVGDEKNQIQIADLVSRHLENILIDSLLFYFEKYPTDNVELAQGRPVTLIERATRGIKIRIRYWDSLENEYEPINVLIPIEDIRTDKKRRIELPINIHWKQELINPLAEASKCPT